MPPINQFSRTELLFGRDGMDKLARAEVAVFGVGGVGGYAVEALARSGVGSLALFDDDKICLTNLNRQLHATRKTIGKYKDALTVDIKPEHTMEKVLYATDELTGLIGAVALMRPSKSVMDLEVKSVMKKYKTANFAAGCSREVIQRGADMLGWELHELIAKTILAMRETQSYS